MILECEIVVLKTLLKGNKVVLLLKTKGLVGLCDQKGVVVKWFMNLWVVKGYFCKIFIGNRWSSFSETIKDEGFIYHKY